MDDATLERLKQAASSNDESVWKPAAQELAALKINANHRRSFADAIFDHVTLLETKDERLFGGITLYDWTNDRSSGGRLVSAGGAGSGGVDVNRWDPMGRGGSLGVSFSR